MCDGRQRDGMMDVRFTICSDLSCWKDRRSVCQTNLMDSVSDERLVLTVAVIQLLLCVEFEAELFDGPNIKVIKHFLIWRDGLVV